eukprot:gene31802-38444_t
MYRTVRRCRRSLQGLCTQTRVLARPTARKVGSLVGLGILSLQPRLALCDAAIYDDNHEAILQAGSTGESSSLISTQASASWLQQLQHWLALLYRALYLLFAYSPAAVTSPLLLLPGGADWWWAVLLGCVKRAGPCSVKFAQWLSTRPDLFPLQLCNRFQALQSYSGSLSWKEAHAVLDRELGPGWRQQLRVLRRGAAEAREGEGLGDDDHVEPEVLGEGCVAQVLRGELRGVPVAVKLLRKSVNEATAPRWLVLATRQISARPAYAVVQVSALSVGLLALLLLVLLRTDLISSWRKATPPDAPNRFVINVMPEQGDAFLKNLRDAGVGKLDWYPMIRGRLVAVNGKPVGPDNYTDDRAKRLVDREFNLSHSSKNPPHNLIVGGRWTEDEEGAVKLSGEISLPFTATRRQRIMGYQSNFFTPPSRSAFWKASPWSGCTLMTNRLGASGGVALRQLLMRSVRSSTSSISAS